MRTSWLQGKAEAAGLGKDAGQDLGSREAEVVPASWMQFSIFNLHVTILQILGRENLIA